MSAPGRGQLALFECAVGERFAAAERCVLAWPALFGGAVQQCSLLYHRRLQLLVAQLEWGPGQGQPEQRARLAFWAAEEGGWALERAALAARPGLAAHLKACDVRLEGLTPDALPRALAELTRRAGVVRARPAGKAPLEVRLDLGASPCRTSDVSPHGLFVESEVLPPLGDVLPLRLAVPGAPAPFTVRAAVTHARSPAGRRVSGQPAGFGLSFLQAPPELTAALAGHLAAPPGGARQEGAAPARGAPPARPPVPARTQAPAPAPSSARGPVPAVPPLPGVRRSVAPPAVPPVAAPVRTPGPPPAATRVPERLRLAYPDVEALGRDWAQNLSHGGAWVHAERPLPLHASVEVTLALPEGVSVWGRRELTLRGTVVHAQGEDVGVQLTLPPAARAELDAALERALHKRRALVVDGDTRWSAMLAEALRARGYEVLVATESRRALDTLFNEYLALDALVSDIHMPGLRGEELVKRVRLPGGEDALALLLVSVRVAEEDRRQLAFADVDGLLDKTVGPDAVAAAVDAEVTARRRVVEKARAVAKRELAERAAREHDGTYAPS